MQVITNKDKMTSRPSRNLMNVIENSLKIIPSTETDLIEKLKWILNSCCYTAPDVMYIRWTEFMAALNEYLKNKKIEILFYFLMYYTNFKHDKVKPILLQTQ